jgi:O-antigen/teichoic acid export membrane protein
VLLYSVGFLMFNFLLQINFNILAAIWQVKKRLKIVSLGLVVNIVLNIVCIYYMLTYHASWASGSAFAVGVSWIFIWYLSYRATKEYHEPFLWKNFLKNLVFCTILTLVLWKFRPRDIETIGKLGYFLSLLVSVFLYSAGYIFINRAELLGIYRTFKTSKSWVPPLS